VKRLMCFGRCNEGPNIRVAPGGAFFTRMNRERLDEVIEAVRVAMSATE
jgi:(2Fe-2S) ferredoxin